MRIAPLSAVVVVIALAGCASTPKSSGEGVRGEVACQPTSEQEIAALFDRWNRSLESGNADAVVANYAERSVLLATLSNKPRVTAEEKVDYFHHFLEKRPTGRIDWRMIFLGCNAAVDAGLYTFTFRATGAQVKARYSYSYHWDGAQWLITSHHSSAMPEPD